MPIDTISFKRRRLPHWQVDRKAYFVTFRLRNSLPKEVVLELKKERENLLRNKNSDKELLEFYRREFKKMEMILDSVRNDDNAYLTGNEIAPFLMDAFEHLSDKYCWRFPSFVIMPNHVHCLCVADKAGEKISLTKIFGLFKRFTGKKINEILEQEGRVWVDENFDHWCRTPDKEERVKKYIANNPVKAGLVRNSIDWK
jgi:REP element-mobilizing transposase RayT